jgi:3-dehydroquinate synthase
MKIKVNIPQSEYNVYLGNGNFPKLPTYLKKEMITGNILLVIDSNVKKLYSKIIESTFLNLKTKVKSITITTNEKNKSFETLKKIHSVLIKNNFGRDSIIVAIGGGIIGDITGFAASTYMRGIKYVQVPTTLLASVDSSVGGKTGINFGRTKNVIGSFYQPELVLIDTNFFSTLNDSERLCGLGEIIKYAFLTNHNFYNFVQKNISTILNNDTQIVAKVIKESISFKGSVVEADEKEAGIRKVLNLGHTFAHAFEVEQNHKLKHGQAVIVGITSSLYLSKSLNLITTKDFNKYLDFLLLFSASIKLKDANKNHLYKLMLRDKKNRQNEIKFVLVREIGEIITDVPAQKHLVIDSLTQTISHFS